jgi:hypothetical protein
MNTTIPRRRGLAALVAGGPIVAGAAALAVRPADAADLACGATITRNTVLEHDLTDCPAVGLRIGADHVTLDLNGHSVSGASGGNRAHGILNVGHDGVVVSNGTVTGTVTPNRISGSRFVGVNLMGGAANLVREKRIADSAGHAVLIQSSQTERGGCHRVLGNVVIGNGIWINPGPRAITIAGNFVRGGD